MAPNIKYALIPIFLACSVFGGYATLSSLSKSGLGKILRDVVSGSRAALLGAPAPFKRDYTGVAAIDSQLRVLVLFFSSMIDGAIPPETILFYVWGMGQFAAGWTIMLIESTRAGNKGRLVSYAGTFGFFTQNITWTVSLPIWLSLYLLTSPVAKLTNASGPAAQKTLETTNTWDAVVLPLTVVLSFIVPTVFMSIPELLNHSAATHYGWMAVWQAFPLWGVLLLILIRQGPARKDQTSRTPSTSYIYRFALVLTVGTHLPILGLALLPAPIRSSLASSVTSLSGLARLLVESGTFTNIFVPRSSPFDAHPPSLNPTGYVSGDLAPVATQFLQYDLLVPSVPFLLWAIYLRQTAVKNASLLDALKTASYWLVLGGPHAAVVALLWDRDAIVAGGNERTLKKIN